jgi:type IV pilus biogenesis protein CpaD/CtpE
MKGMRYKVVELPEGKYAVGFGKRYFTDEVYDSEQAAQIRVVEMSAQYYQSMIYACQSKWEELQGGETNENGSNFGDILA